MAGKPSVAVCLLAQEERMKGKIKVSRDGAHRWSRRINFITDGGESGETKFPRRSVVYATHTRSPVVRRSWARSC